MEQPFQDIQIFKEQTARNVVDLSPQNKVAELVQADKDAEIVLLGILKGHMLDLYEALSWQYANKEVSLQSFGCTAFRYFSGTGLVYRVPKV